MKQNRILIAAVVIIAIAGIFACSKRNSGKLAGGQASFTIKLPAVKSLQKAADSTTVSFHILISVTAAKGTAIFTDKLFPLYLFGTEYITDNIEIKEGNYLLTKFMVINPAGVVIYATPVAGSPLAYLCNNPLPSAFAITAGQVTNISPEVLAVENQPPESFGYASFGFQVVNPLEFWVECILQPADSMSAVMLTDATLTVISASGWQYIFAIASSVNDLVIQGGSDTYTFVADKQGYPEQKISVTAKELQATSKASPYIIRFPGTSVTQTIILQPGPADGKDAMISLLQPDTNFGNWPYFETTYLPDSVLTVMKSTRSLIAFSLDLVPKTAIIGSAVLRLFYDVPVPFDPAVFPTDSVSSGVVWYGGVLQQVITLWDESTVTWNTQPKTIEIGQVFISPFIRNTNYIDINVTSLIYSPAASAMNALPNYGMMLKLWPTEKFPGFRFCSSDWPVAAMRPMLTVTYTGI
jgi:hypothetical protein